MLTLRPYSQVNNQYKYEKYGLVIKQTLDAPPYLEWDCSSFVQQLNQTKL